MYAKLRARLGTSIWTLVLVLFFFFETGEAQSRRPGPSSKTVPFKENRATLNFEDELVEGSTQKPDLFYLFQRKNFNYNRLIKLRENFLPEMRKTTEDIQRVRSTN